MLTCRLVTRTTCVCDGFISVVRCGGLDGRGRKFSVTIGQKNCVLGIVMCRL